MFTAKRQHKYNAKPTHFEGIRFASKREANYYGMLKLREKAGEVRDIELQPTFELVAPDNLRHEVFRGYVKVGVYRADFAFDEWQGERWARVVVDVKGYKTPLYRWKKRHTEIQHGVIIREV